MSIAFKAQATSANLNAAFGSKSADNTYTGQQDFARPASGDSVIDVQARINYNTIKTYVTEDIAGGGTISSDVNFRHQVRRVQGDGGAQIAAALPFGSGGTWTDGLLIELQGMSDANTLQINNNDTDNGIILNDGVLLKRFYVLLLRWDAVEKRFIEITRNWA